MPTLELDDGSRLTEGPAIVQYLADKVPEKKLAAPNGTMPRYRQQEWLNFITSELHKGIGGLFNPAMPEEAKALMREKALTRLKWVDAQLEGKAYTAGDRSPCPMPTCSWSPTGPAGRHRHLRPEEPGRLHGADGARPSVQAAMKDEGLLK